MAFLPALGAALVGGGAAAALGTVGTAVVGGVAVAGATAAAVGTVKSVKSAKAASVAARSAAETQVRVQKAAETRTRRASIRNFLRTRSRFASAAAASGVQTSAAAGGMASLSSQFGANLGFGGQISSLNQQITALSGIQNTQTALSGMYGNIAGFGLSVMGRAGMIGGGISSMFPTGTPIVDTPYSYTQASVGEAGR